MWIALSSVSNQESVILIRMFCTPQLQKALDNRIAVEEWARLAPANAIDLLEGITVKYTSRAADIGAFYSLKQGPYESIGHTSPEDTRSPPALNYVVLGAHKALVTICY